MSRGPGLVRLGFDEAGLGPTLGPLVVAGFATRSRFDPAERGPVDDLRAVLAAAVGPPGTRDGRLEVGDSKKIHAGTRKLERIERTALATVCWLHGRVPHSVRELFELVHAGNHERPEDRRAPWWATLDEALPIVGERAAILTAAERLAATAKNAGVSPLWYGADVVSAARVNRELEAESEAGGTKNTWATHAVLRLATQAEAELAAPRAALWCDKAGGRMAYRAPLLRAFDSLGAGLEQPGAGGDGGLVTVVEQRACSRYQLELGERSVELGFVMKGDRLDPRISWASILAKYLRELILRSFNRYFAARLPDLRPTAGYPEDAKRFIAELRAALKDELPERSAWIRSK